MSPRRRFPALDGLRGVAILLTFARHFVSNRIEVSEIGKLARVGWIGVDLFFVLSGFLITGILLDARGRPDYYRAFYARRARRILPAFALFMGVLLFVAVTMPGITPDSAQFLRFQPWYWLFAVNWLAVHVRDLTAIPYATGHLWSLAIEEQFYLAWPLVVALVSSRSLRRVLWSMIAVAFMVRVGMVLAHATDSQIYVTTPARLDGLAAGALVALWWRAGDHGRIIRRIADAPLVVWLALVVGFDLTLKLLEPDALPFSPAAHLFMYPIVAAMGALMIASVLVAPNGPLARALSAHWLRVIGKYSFAMYLWQVPVDHLLRVLGLGATETGELAYFLLGTVVTFLVAMASWRLVEARALGIRRQPYTVTAPPVRGVSVV